MKLFFAGSDGEDRYNKILLENGVTHRLESFFYLKNKASNSPKMFDYLLDSGGYTARTHGKTIKITDYINYINKFGIKTAFNLDTMNFRESQMNHKLLVENTDCYIIPVYHLEEYIDVSMRYVLDLFIEQYPYISIGGIAGNRNAARYKKQIYGYVFNKCLGKTKVHGLGISGIDELKAYPWYSVDSTSWLAAARFGRIAGSIKDKRMRLMKQKTKHFLDNSRDYIIELVKIEKMITELWAKKGIIYE